MIIKTIVFCDVPIYKGFKCLDRFQLVPFPKKELNIIKKYVSHYPLFLEYKIEEVEEILPFEDKLKSMGFSDSRIHEARLYPIQNRVRKEILQLLTCLTNYHFFSYDQSDALWGTQVSLEKCDTSDEDFLFIETLKSKWTIGCYKNEDIKDLIINEFSMVSSYYDTFNDDYFTEDPTKNYSPEFSIPQYLEFSIEQYFNLEETIYNKVRYCIGMLSDGIELFDKKRSVSLLSIISSVEGMAKIDNEIYEPNLKLKVTERFVRYLKTYVASRSAEKFKKFYLKRCDVTHESELFIGDLDIFADAKKQDEDMLLRLEIMQAARMAFYNWLRRKRP